MEQDFARWEGQEKVVREGIPGEGRDRNPHGVSR